jgi:hypothetical protein
MMAKWYTTGTRLWWTTGALFFLGLELALRIKPGSIFVLGGLWAMAHQWLASRLGHELDPDPRRRFTLALYATLVFCVIIFIVFGSLNAGLRTLNPEWRFFQLP